MFVYLLITLAILWASRLTHGPEFNAMLVTFGLGAIVYVVWHVRDRASMSVGTVSGTLVPTASYGEDLRATLKRPDSWPKCGSLELIEQLRYGKSANIYLAREHKQGTAEVIVKVSSSIPSLPNELQHWEQ